MTVVKNKWGFCDISDYLSLASFIRNRELLIYYITSKRSATCIYLYIEKKMVS